MDKESVRSIIEQFKKELTQKGIVIKKVVLYGSHAKKTQREDSDINVVVVSDSFKDMEYWDRIEILSETICDIFQPIEAFAVTTEEWEKKSFIAAEYAKDGIEV